MLSKKDLSSDALDTLRRSRNPTTVVIANGEVHGEAQMYVQDLDLFVTMQIRAETSVVLSLGKLCSEHEYSYGWKNDETPRLSKNENIIICTMDNFVTLVVSGLTSSSSSSSTSTSRVKGQSSSSGESEKSSDPVTTRCDQQEYEGSTQTDPEKSTSGNRDSANKDEMDKKDPTQDIPDCLQPFTDNLEDLETYVSAHSSQRWHKSKAQYLYSLSQRPKLRRMLWGPKLRGLLAEDAVTDLFRV